MNLRIDKEFESRIPPLTSDEFQQLEANILADGIVINPIIVWNGVIVDGHNRYHIIEKHPEIKYTTYEKHFDDRYAVVAWICKNQLGRRNLTPDQKKYLIGKQYEAEKSSHGAEHFQGNQYAKVVSGQNVHSPKPPKTSERIAQENGANEKYVRRAEHYAKGIDLADEVEPGIRSELLSGKLKATEKDIKEFVAAEPDKRPAIIDRIRNPPEQDKPKKKAPKPKDPELALIQKIADDMLEARSNGKPGTMIYEMTDAMESMIFRWNFCKSNYPAFFELEECLSEIRKLIRNGHEFLTQYEGGLPHYDDTCTPV